MSLTTSNTYNFHSLENDELILECFERIGMPGDKLVPLNLKSAKRSLNLLLLDWLSKSINLWTLKKAFLSLNAKQSKYTLSSIVTDILQVNLRQFTRQLNGVATASEGVAINAFDENPLTSCTQININGNITYDYTIGNVRTINFVGIQSNVTRDYNLQIEVSNDGVNWSVIQIIAGQTYKKGIVEWFDIISPITARYCRISETGGEILDIQELYFTDNIVDLILNSVSRDTYLSFSQKFMEGRPSCYYFDKQIVPELNIWNAPSNIYKVLQYSYVNVMQDAGGFYNVTDIPARMLPALTWGLTWMLAIKYNSAAASDMKNEYEQAFAVATANDSENIGLTLNYDIGSYYEN